MEVSAVKVRPETFQLAERPMKAGRRRELRRELIVEYIKSKPYGKRIKMAEFEKVGQFKTHQNTAVFVKRMMRDGVIVRHDLSLRKFFYTVPGQVKTKTVSTPPPRGDSGARFTAQEIEQRAKDFSWANPDNQNDLRKFIGELVGKP